MTEFFNNLDYFKIISNIGILIFGLLFVIAFYLYRSMESQIKTGIGNAVVNINNRLVVDKKFFNYEEKIRKYKSYGVLETSPKLAKPHYYILIHLALGLAGAFGLYIVKPILFPIGFVIGWIFLDFYYKRRNDKDNLAMMEDIFAITNILSTQIKGGVYVGNALAECKDIVLNKRLKRALKEFDRHIQINDMTLLEATDELESKFDSTEISSLCMIVRQNEETGRLREIINDLAKQINATEETIFQKKKSDTERSLTIAILIIFADIMGFVMWNFVQSILQQF